MLPLLAAIACTSAPTSPPPSPPPDPTLTLSIPGTAPACGPASPPLQWSGAPTDTRAYALTLVAPGPDGLLDVRWLWWDLPAPADGLDAGLLPTRAPPVQGISSAGSVGHTDPCGPTPRLLRLHALDAPLRLPPTATWTDLDGALREHTLAWGTLTLPPHSETPL